MHAFFDMLRIPSIFIAVVSCHEDQSANVNLNYAGRQAGAIVRNSHLLVKNKNLLIDI